MEDYSNVFGSMLLSNGKVVPCKAGIEKTHSKKDGSTDFQFQLEGKTVIAVSAIHIPPSLRPKPTLSCFILGLKTDRWRIVDVKGAKQVARHFEGAVDYYSFSIESDLMIRTGRVARIQLTNTSQNIKRPKLNLFVNPDGTVDLQKP